MKKSLIVVLIAIFGAVAAYIWFTKDEIVFSKETSLYKAVPVTAPVFVELSSLKAIPLKNQGIQELSAIPACSWLMKNVNALSHTIAEKEDVPRQWGKRPFIVAFDFVGEKRLEAILISKIKSSGEFKGMESLLNHITGIPNIPAPKIKKYSGYKIFSITDKKGNKLHYCAADGLFLLSAEPILIEKSLRQLNSENLTSIRNFNRVNKTVTAQSDVAWYINHELFPELPALLSSQKNRDAKNEFGEIQRTNPRKEVLKTSNYAGWSELDMAFHDNRISLNGITTADDSLNHFITVFRAQEPQACLAAKILPRNTSCYLSFSFSDAGRFFEKLSTYFARTKTFYKREEALKKMEKRLGKNSRKIWRNMVKKQVIGAITNVSGNGDKSSLFIFPLNSRKENQQQFTGLLKNYARRKKIEFSSLSKNILVGHGNSYTVYHFPYPSFPGIWLGDAFRFAKANYATFYNDYLVFASSEKVMRQYISSMEQGNTLDEKHSYSALKKTMENKTNISFYADVNRLYALKETLFNADVCKNIERNSETLLKFNALSWQMLSEDNVYFNALNIGFNGATDDVNADGEALWTCNLGAPVYLKPQIVLNHNNKLKEIIVQDEDNKLHLLTSAGKQLWSIPVKGNILSEIHQVDVYRNGKLQYLFNTKDKLYLIDRNGNNVSGFPVVFQSKATNGVNVFDYDNNRKYRYFVACENRKIYAFDQKGKLVSGWNPARTESAVTTPVQHFRVNSKDYIVFKDASKVYMLNRRGEKRVNVSARFENSDNPLVLNLNGTPKIVATDKNGNVFYLFFNGKYKEKKVGKFSVNHFFNVCDLEGNKIPDFVFVDNNKLKVVDENGKAVYDYKFNNKINARPDIYSFPAGEKMIGVTNHTENHIYLFTPSGKPYNDFPLTGCSRFSIGTLSPGQLNLLVGNKDGDLIAYRLR